MKLDAIQSRLWPLCVGGAVLILLFGGLVGWAINNKWLSPTPAFSAEAGSSTALPHKQKPTKKLKVINSRAKSVAHKVKSKTGRGRKALGGDKPLHDKSRVVHSASRVAGRTTGESLLTPSGDAPTNAAVHSRRQTTDGPPVSVTPAVRDARPLPPSAANRNAPPRGEGLTAPAIVLGVFDLAIGLLAVGFLEKLRRRLVHSSNASEVLGKRVAELERWTQRVQEVERQMGELGQWPQSMQTIEERVSELEQCPGSIRALEMQVSALEPLPRYVQELTLKVDGLYELAQDIQQELTESVNERHQSAQNVQHELRERVSDLHQLARNLQQQLQDLAERVSRAEQRAADRDCSVSQAATPAMAVCSALETGSPESAEGYLPATWSETVDDPLSSGLGQLSHLHETAPQFEIGARSILPPPYGAEEKTRGLPIPTPASPNYGEQPVPTDPDLSWIREFAEAIQQRRVEAGKVSDSTLDQWVRVASRVEQAEEQSALQDDFAQLMEQSRSLLGIDIVCPQIGSPALQSSVEVVDNGPLDGTVGEVVSVGLRTRDEVLRPARVKAQPR